MIRIAILSDLHLDIRRRHLLRAGLSEAACASTIRELADAARDSARAADLVVLAGDIAGGIDGLEWAAATFDWLPVLYIAGNHEFYRHRHRELLGQLQSAAARTDHVRFLEQGNVTLTLNGRQVRLLGCTAWTDYELYGDAGAGEAMRRAEAEMYDHRRITFDDRLFRASDAHHLHRDAARWLGAELARSDSGTTVVITHHAPAARSVEPRFQGDSLSPAFAADLTGLMQRHAPALWIHGHTHHNVDYAVGSTRVVSHQWGYPGEDVARGCKVVEI